MDYYKTKLIGKLKAESAQAQEELDGIELIFNEAVSLFCQSVSSFCQKKSIKNPLEDLKDSSKEDEEIISDGIKSIFRKIATKTHPDKTISQDLLINQYHDLTIAKKNKDVNKIISIAKELNIKINDISYPDIKIIENSIKKTNDKIQRITNSYPWVWYFSKDSKRLDIIREFVMNHV